MSSSSLNENFRSVVNHAEQIPELTSSNVESAKLNIGCQASLSTTGDITLSTLTVSNNSQFDTPLLVSNSLSSTTTNLNGSVEVKDGNIGFLGPTGVSKQGVAKVTVVNNVEVGQMINNLNLALVAVGLFTTP